MKLIIVVVAIAAVCAEAMNNDDGRLVDHGSMFVQEGCLHRCFCVSMNQ
jgi:hypothetical protein